MLMANDSQPMCRHLDLDWEWILRLKERSVLYSEASNVGHVVECDTEREGGSQGN